MTNKRAIDLKSRNTYLRKEGKELRGTILYPFFCEETDCEMGGWGAGHEELSWYIFKHFRYLHILLNQMPFLTRPGVYNVPKADYPDLGIK